MTADSIATLASIASNVSKSCNTCQFACIVNPISAECERSGMFCPPEMICEFWHQADELTLEQNSHDWTGAKNIEVE